MLRVVTDDDARAEMRSALDEIVLDGARRMLAAALEAADAMTRSSGPGRSDHLLALASTARDPAIGSRPRS